MQVRANGRLADPQRVRLLPARALRQRQSAANDRTLTWADDCLSVIAVTVARSQAETSLLGALRSESGSQEPIGTHPARGCCMAEFVDHDPVRPTAIEHKCEEIFEGDGQEQRYNYLIYHFDRNGVYFWARTYLDDIETVSLYGPFESKVTMKPVGGPLDEAVLAYLKRRFSKIETLPNDRSASI
jgi:hypothetical protein